MLEIGGKSTKNNANTTYQHRPVQHIKPIRLFRYENKSNFAGWFSIRIKRDVIKRTFVQAGCMAHPVLHIIKQYN